MKIGKLGMAALLWGAFQSTSFSFPDDTKKDPKDPPKTEVKSRIFFRKVVAEPVQGPKVEVKKEEKKVEVKVIKEGKKVGKDGQAEAKVQCHVIIIGTDGKKFEFNLGDGKELPPEIKKLVEEAKAKAQAGIKDGKKIEVQRKTIIIDKDGKPVEGGPKVQIELNRIEGNLPEEIKKKIDAAIAAKKIAEALVVKPGAGGDASKKLDLILQRLDKIEKEIEALKKK